MRFWQGMGYTALDELESVARHAEKLGFYGVTLGDHLVTANTQVDRYNLSEDGKTPWEDDAPWPDPMVVFASLAPRTTTLQFMTTVYILPVRDAFTAAKAIGTAAVMTGGRLHLGVGVGWQQLEFRLTGQPFERRGSRVDEQLEVLRKLWTGTQVEHGGTFYGFPRVRMLPAPAARIPIYIGGVSDAAFRRAARHDGWEGAVYPWKDIEDKVKRVQAARLAAVGTLDDFRVIVGCTEPTPERLETLRAWGVTDYLKPPWTAGLRPTNPPLADKLDEMSRFAATYRVGGG
ncbi:MAG: TIGR03619 family F420-dependent LLM class oxidoreductase [Candidatus Binatia bacterium]